MTKKTTYKDPLYVLGWLDTALKKEWQKYPATPVTPDMFPSHEIAQDWGYVVAGYFLIEQGLKAVLYMRGGEPPKIHALSVLFAELPVEDQGVLRAYYDDFCHTFPGMGSFPLTTLDDFLMNLDGGRNGQSIESFDWRYFLTEEGRGASMPFVSINVMHEVVYGRDALWFGLYTGMRRDEVLPLRWQQVDMATMTFRVEETKTGVPPELPITRQLSAILERRRVEGEGLPDNVRAWVFPSLTSASGHVEDPHYLYSRITKAGGAKFWFHGFRNCFITVAERELMLPQSLTKRLVNHARSNDVTEGYASDWTAEQLREPAQRIADRVDVLMDVRPEELGRS